MHVRHVNKPVQAEIDQAEIRIKSSAFIRAIWQRDSTQEPHVCSLITVKGSVILIEAEICVIAVQVRRISASFN